MLTFASKAGHESKRVYRKKLATDIMVRKRVSFFDFYCLVENIAGTFVSSALCDGVARPGR